MSDLDRSSSGAFSLEMPSLKHLTELGRSDDIFDRALFELWRGRAPVSSVRAARLSREMADAILMKLAELGV